MVNSINDKTGDEIGCFLSRINTPFNTLKTEAVNAAKIPNKIPKPYFISTEKIRPIATIIITKSNHIELYGTILSIDE